MRLPSVIIASFVLVATGCSKPEPPAATPDSASPSEPAAAASGDGPAAGKPKSLGKAVVGQPAPDFELTGLDGAKEKLSAHKGKIVVLEWFNPDCPFVRQAHGPGTLNGLAAKMKEKHGDIVWLAVNSGAPGKQGHGEETNRAGKEKFGVTYPILFDADGAVGHAYAATNTPHMYVIDKEGVLVYAGALDNTRSGDPEDAEPELINYLTDALDDVTAGKPVRTPTTKAWGCSVKYARK